MILPTPSTLKRYYPVSKLSGEQIAILAEFVRAQQGTNGISPDNKILKALVSWEDMKA